MRDTIDMAEEAGAISYWHLSKLKAFEALVRSDEREACARVCDEYSATGKIEEFDRGWLACAKNTATAIRARSNT